MVNGWYSQGISLEEVSGYSSYRGVIAANKLRGDDFSLDLTILLPDQEIRSVFLEQKDVVGLMNAAGCRFCDDLNGKSVNVYFSSNSLFKLKQLPDLVGISIL